MVSPQQSQQQLLLPNTIHVNKTHTSYDRNDGTVNFADLLRINNNNNSSSHVIPDRVVMSSFGADLQWLFEHHAAAASMHNTFRPAPILQRVKEIILVHSSKDLQADYVRLLAASSATQPTTTNEEDEDKDVIIVDVKKKQSNNNSNAVAALVVKTVPELIQSKQLKFHLPPLPIEYGSMHAKFVVRFSHY